MGIASFNIRECLENAEGRLRESGPEPRPGAWLLVDAVVDVPKEACKLLLISWLCFKVDEERFASRSVVDAGEDECWVGVRGV